MKRRNFLGLISFALLGILPKQTNAISKPLSNSHPPYTNKLKNLYISKEAMDDIRKWSVVIVDEVREIYCYN